MANFEQTIQFYTPEDRISPSRLCENFNSYSWQYVQILIWHPMLNSQQIYAVERLLLIIYWTLYSEFLNHLRQCLYFIFNCAIEKTCSKTFFFCSVEQRKPPEQHSKSKKKTEAAAMHNFIMFYVKEHSSLENCDLQDGQADPAPLYILSIRFFQEFPDC